MATVKTYILAPNFTYHPDTSICMGDIIQDPSDPTKPLSIPPDPSALAAESHIDYDAKFSEQKSHSLKGSIWATFLQTVSARSGGGVSGDVLDQYLGTSWTASRRSTSRSDRRTRKWRRGSARQGQNGHKLGNFREEPRLHDNWAQGREGLQAVQREELQGRWERVLRGSHGCRHRSWHSCIRQQHKRRAAVIQFRSGHNFRLPTPCHHLQGMAGKGRGYHYVQAYGYYTE